MLGMVRREHERAGYEAAGKRSRRVGGGAAGGGAYARDAFDSDVREEARRRERTNRDEAEVERRAMDGELRPSALARVLAMDDDWLDMQGIDDWYKG